MYKIYKSCSENKKDVKRENSMNTNFNRESRWHPKLTKVTQLAQMLKWCDYFQNIKQYINPERKFVTLNYKQLLREPSQLLQKTVKLW